jgi:acetyl coenzyme A synthetase (ADP forming)-like protein
VRVAFPTSFSEEALARFEDRDRIAARSAVEPFMEPVSIAVVGASRRRGTVGGEVLRNLIESGYARPIWPVNPAASEVQSLPAHATIAQVPGEVDLVVISVAADAVPKVARECAERGARTLVVLSAGFAELGERGARRQRDLLAICRETGMRLVGPNCLGVLNSTPGAEMNATFAPTVPPPGNIGFVTQSGALGLALIELAVTRGLGVASFASVGNRADITANDMLDFWEEDERVALGLLYIESFSDPRRFARAAKRFGRRKPVVVVKSGRSAAGARAAGSHTGALLAASDRTAQALFEQSGVIRAETLAEMFDVASLLSSQPLPQGPRVGILTNAGGPGIMCADACDAAGLEVPPLPDPFRAELREFLPAEASLGNPVDTIATATADQFRRAISALAGWGGIDALIAIFIRPLLAESEDVAGAVRDAARDLPREIPILAVFMSPPDSDRGAAGKLPTYSFPEDAARALGKAARHARWRQRPAASPPALEDVRAGEAAAILSEALAVEREWLGVEECARLLDCYGIAMPEALTAANAEAAGRAAACLGGRVALKAHGPQILHKSELGAVQTGLEGEEGVSRAAREMDRKLSEASVERATFLVQRMVEEGVELLVGVAADPVFGPVVACGAGGTAVELLGDVAVRVCPLGAGDPAEMIDSLAISPLLGGFRGLPPVDRGALERLVTRVGALADNHPEVAELDLNPVLASARGALAADARVRVASAPPRRPWPRTWNSGRS